MKYRENPVPPQHAGVASEIAEELERHGYTYKANKFGPDFIMYVTDYNGDVARLNSKPELLKKIRAIAKRHRLNVGIATSYDLGLQLLVYRPTAEYGEVETILSKAQNWLMKHRGKNSDRWFGVKLGRDGRPLPVVADGRFMEHAEYGDKGMEQADKFSKEVGGKKYYAEHAGPFFEFYRTGR